MAEVKVYSGGAVSSTDIDPALFGDKVLGRTLKDAAVMYEANVRSGTAKAKTRGEVSGPNKKLWKQKHTGRARMGSKKVVHWRGGGVVFGPLPRDYSYQMPKKARRVALRNAIYTKFTDGEVAVADGWPSERPSTRQAASILRAMGLETSVLVVTAELDRTLHLSLRNVPMVDVRTVDDLNARDVLLRRHMVLTPAAMERIKARFGDGSPSVRRHQREAAASQEG